MTGKKIEIFGKSAEVAIQEQNKNFIPTAQKVWSYVRCCMTFQNIPYCPESEILSSKYLQSIFETSKESSHPDTCPLIQ